MILTIDDRIRVRQVNFFNNFKLSLKYDAVGSAFSLGFYFNPENPEHKELVCIGHYHICRLEHNGELLLTGVILSQTFKSRSTYEYAEISGYSLAGVLEDCEIPPSLYPLQSDGLNLKQIAEKLIQPFGLKLQIDSSVLSKVTSSFKSSTAKDSQTIKTYLSSLASQKNIIISHNEKGDLLFTSAKTDSTPIAHFEKSFTTEMDLVYDGQKMHSHITVMKEADSDGGNAGEQTIRNPYVINSVYRPKVISQSSGDDNDTNDAARLALSDELKNIKLKINTDRWIIDGKIVKPNNIISVTNPQVFLFKKSNWFIESVDLTGNEKETTAVLNCVLPEVYNNETPNYLWSGVNLH